MYLLNWHLVKLQARIACALLIDSKERRGGTISSTLHPSMQVTYPTSTASQQQGFFTQQMQAAQSRGAAPEVGNSVDAIIALHEGQPGGGEAGRQADVEPCTQCCLISLPMRKCRGTCARL